MTGTLKQLSDALKKAYIPGAKGILNSGVSLKNFARRDERPVDYVAIAIAQLQGHKYGRAEAVRQRLLGADKQKLKSALRRFKRMKRDRLKRFLKDHPERLEDNAFVGADFASNAGVYGNMMTSSPAKRAFITGIDET